MIEPHQVVDNRSGKEKEGESVDKSLVTLKFMLPHIESRNWVARKCI